MGVRLGRDTGANKGAPAFKGGESNDSLSAGKALAADRLQTFRGGCNLAR